MRLDPNDDPRDDPRLDPRDDDKEEERAREDKSSSARVEGKSTPGRDEEEDDEEIPPYPERDSRLESKEEYLDGVAGPSSSPVDSSI